MIKIGIEVKNVGETLNIKIVTPTEKQVQNANSNEVVLAEKITKILNTKLLDLLEEKEN